MREVELKQAGKVVPAGSAREVEGSWVVAVGRQIYRVKAGEVEAAIYDYPQESDITALHQIDSSTCLLGDSAGQISRLKGFHTLEKVHKVPSGVTALQGWAGVVVAGMRTGGVVVGGDEEIALQGVGQGAVLQVSFSPSGRLFSLLTSTATLSVYRLGNWQLLHSSAIWTSVLPAPQLTVGWNRTGEVLALPGDVRLNFLRPEEEAAEATEFEAPSHIVAVAYTHADELLYLLTLAHSLLLYSQLSRTVVGAYSLPSLPATITALPDCLYCSCPSGLYYVTRGDFKLAAARKLLEAGQIDPFQTAIGALPQDALPTANPTLLFQSLLGSITRSEQHSTLSSQQLSFFSISVTFSKPDFHKNLHFPDLDNISLAHMSESGAIFGSKLKGELGEDDFVEEDKQNRKALVQFKSLTECEDWVVKLSGREDVEKLCVGGTWCAVFTSQMILRVFACRGGVQLYTFSFACSIVALSTHNETLAVLYQASLPSLGLQRLAFNTYTIHPSTSQGLKAVLAPIPPQETLVWAGFSAEGVLSCADSKGYVRMYEKERQMWERVGKLEGWRVVGIRKREIYGFKDQEKYLSRVKVESETIKVALTGEKLEELLRLPPNRTINDQFLREFHCAIQANSHSDVKSLIQSLAAPLDVKKAFKILRSLSPDLFTALSPPRQALVSERPAKLTKEA